MRLLSRYLLRECVGPFLFALGALTGLMLLNQVARRFGDLVGKGLSWDVIGEVFGLSVPFIVAMTLPMAVLVAVLYAFSRIGGDNEVTALKASGVNLMRTIRPVLAAGAALAMLNFAFNDQVLPRANHALTTLLVSIARKKPTFELREQMVNEVIPGQFYLRAGRIDQAADRLRDIVIYDLANTARRRTIYADSGYMRFNQERTDLHLTLFDGYVHDYDRAQPGIFRRVFFRTDYVRMRGVSNSLERSGDSNFRSDREMSVCEMEDAALGIQDGLDGLVAERDLARENDIRALLGVSARGPEGAVQRRSGTSRGISVAPYCRLLGAVRRLVLPRAARAEAVQSDRTRRPPGPRAALPQHGEARDPAAHAGRSPAAAPADLRGDHLRSQQSLFTARRAATQIQLARYRVEIHKKFAIPAMCIVFVLIGAPLALRFPRGGVGLVIGASAAIFGLYYIGLIGGESLADKLIITPFWAMWSPNLLMTAAGLALFARMGREHATSRGAEWPGAAGGLLDRWRARGSRV